MARIFWKIIGVEFCMMNKQISELVCAYIAERKDSARIVFAALQGGFGRGTANENSDIDIVLAFADRVDITDQSRITQYQGRRIEIRFLCFSEVQHPAYWLERTRYIYKNETIFLFGNADAWHTLQQQCLMTETEKRDLLVFSLKRCARRGIHCKSGVFRVDQTGSAYNTSTAWGKSRRNYWLDRGDYVTAKLLCASSLEYLILIIFALNNEFLPSPKYRYYLLQRLGWKPKSLDMLFTAIREDVSYSYDAMQDLFCDILTECMVKAYNDQALTEDQEAYQFSTNLPVLRETAYF